MFPVECEPSFRQYRTTLFCLSDYLLFAVEFVNALPLLWCEAAFTNSTMNDSIRKCKTIAICPGSREPDCWIKVFQNIHHVQYSFSFLISFHCKLLQILLKLIAVHNDQLSNLIYLLRFMRHLLKLCKPDTV